MSLAAGARLGPYEILSVLGSGGMGEVYRARDTRLDRTVAIKVLPAAMAGDADFRQRFDREARAIAALNHPHICVLHDVGHQDGTDFLVMERLQGETLAARIAKGPLPVNEAVAIGIQIADALDAAHRAGFTHRDLKPGNIMLVKTAGQSSPHAKLLDFGLAKFKPAAGAVGSLAEASTKAATLTSQGAILGTLHYMAPEQVEGKDADARTDIFAFGAILSEMLTGRRLFEGPSAASVMAAILERDVPPLSSLMPAVPSALDRIVVECLQKNPDDRWQSAGDLKRALGWIGNSTGAAAERQQRSHRPIWKRAIPVVLGIVIGAALGGIALWEWKPSPAAAVARFSIPLPEVQQMNFVNNGNSVAISPDGDQIVYEADHRLYIRPISESEAKPIAGTEDSLEATFPTFSPDGRSLAFFAIGEGNLKSVPVTGGTAITLATADPLGIDGVSWTRDGIVFGQGLKSIVQVPAEGGEPKVVIKAGSSEYIAFPEMLPDGKAILFNVSDTTRNRNLLVVQSLTSGERKVLIEQPAGLDFAAHYLDTGHIVYGQGSTLFAIPFNPRRLETAGKPVAVIQGVRRAKFAPIFSVSRTGSLIFIPGPIVPAGSYDLALADRTGFFERLQLPPRPYETPRVSPDGKRIAFGIDDGTEANIETYDLSGASSPTRLTFGGKNRFPVWSPDGQRIAFQSDREGDLGIFSQPAGGGLPERLTKPAKGVAHAPESWSGDTLLFRVIEGENVSLWTYSLRERKAAAFGGVKSLDPTNAVFSPDGRWVAYHVREPGKDLHEVTVQPYPATGARYQLPVRLDNHHPVWFRDGKGLIYLPGPGEFAAISFTTAPIVAFGNPVPVRVPLLTTAPSDPRQYDLTLDDKLIGRVPFEQSRTGAPSTPQITVILNWLNELKERVPVK